MSREVRYVHRQTFRLEPDCYDGETCDKLRPRWMTSYPKEGDEEDGETLRLEMQARMYPPGTRVIIEVPVCPKCGDPADCNEPRGYHNLNSKRRTWPNCRCGFSWTKWVRDNFS